MSRLDSFSDAHGFLVVYPDGLDRSWTDGRGVTPSDKNNVNDVKFLSGLIVAASMSDILASSCDPAKPGSVLLMQGSKIRWRRLLGGLSGKNGDRGTVLPHECQRSDLGMFREAFPLK